jgi:hypothetical protein
MSYCSNCGAELAEGSAFCPSCGAGQVRSVNVPEQPVSTPIPEVIPAEPIYRQPVYQQPVYQQIVQTPVLSGAAKILGIISMVCGLVSLASCLYGWAPGIAAIILSSIASNKAPGVPNSKARIGKITGIIGTILGAVCFIAYLIYCFILGFSVGSEYYI